MILALVVVGASLSNVMGVMLNSFNANRVVS